jgi:hypothetical protein
MGEIVKIGDATLYHADCRDVLPTLGKLFVPEIVQPEQAEIMA